MLKTKAVLCIAFLFLISLSAVSAEGFDISGRVFFCMDGVVHIVLTDEQRSSSPVEAIEKISLSPSAADISKGYIDYVFRDVEGGVYGIKCFQDINANGKLDAGLFGPKEPWGMSWSGKRVLPPGFKDYSFELDKNLVMEDIILVQ